MVTSSHSLLFQNLSFPFTSFVALAKLLNSCMGVHLCLRIQEVFLI